MSKQECACVLCQCHKVSDHLRVSFADAERLEELWAAAYVQGVGDAVSDSVVVIDPTMCGRHLDLMVRWIKHYLKGVVAEGPEKVAEVAVAMGDLFGLTVEAVMIPKGPIQ